MCAGEVRHECDATADIEADLKSADEKALSDAFCDIRHVVSPVVVKMVSENLTWIKLPRKRLQWFGAGRCYAATRAIAID